MSSNESHPGYALVLGGIAAIAALAILFSGFVAGVAAGIGLIALAGLRLSGRANAAIAARSTRFDVTLLLVLGVGVLVLALTADNI